MHEGWCYYLQYIQEVQSVVTTTENLWGVMLLIDERRQIKEVRRFSTKDRKCYEFCQIVEMFVDYV